MSAPNFNPNLIDIYRDGSESCVPPFLGADCSLFAIWIRALMACLGGEEMATAEDRRDLFGLVQELAATIEVLHEYGARETQKLLSKTGGES